MKTVIFRYICIAVIIFSQYSYVKADKELQSSKIIYISSTGIGTLCSKNSPCSLSQALKVVKPGYIIHIVGKLTSAVVIPANKDGTKSAPIILRGGIIDGNSYSNQSGGAALKVLADYWIIKNVEIRNAYRFGALVIGNHVWFDNVNLHHNVRRYMNSSKTACNNTSGSGWESAIRFVPYSVGGGVKNSTIHHNCGEGLTALASRRTTFRNNTVYDNYSVNIYVDETVKALIHKNKITCSNAGFYRDNKPSFGISFGIEGYGNTGTVQADVLNNLVINCKGITLYSKISGGKLINSTIAYNDFSTVKIPAIYLPANSIMNVTISNNIGVSGINTTASYTSTALPPFATPTIMLVSPTETRTPDSPTDIILSSISLDENQPSGTVIASLSTIDLDTQDFFIYSFIDDINCSGNDNSLFEISGSELKTTVSFDYEMQNSYTICIRTTDLSALIFDKQFIINVNNVNDELPTTPLLNNEE